MRGIQSDKAARVKFEGVRGSAKVRVSKFILSLNHQQLGELVLKWQELYHPNVIPCMGLTMQFGPIPALIFPMCTDGSIMQYIEKNPSVNKIQLVIISNKYYMPFDSPVSKVGTGCRGL